VIHLLKYGGDVKTSASFVTLYSKVATISDNTTATGTGATGAVTADTTLTDDVATITKRKSNATDTGVTTPKTKKARAPKTVGLNQ
jgi:hypothetical protein